MDLNQIRRGGKTDFYNKLQNVNDKITVFKSAFYAKTPKFDTNYCEAKEQKTLEIILKKQRQKSRFAEKLRRKLLNQKSPEKIGSSTLRKPSMTEESDLGNSNDLSPMGRNGTGFDAKKLDSTLKTIQIEDYDS